MPLPDGATVRCKGYHDARVRTDIGGRRSQREAKSRCPGWVSEAVRARLLAEALVEEAELDSFGRPKRVWNAVNGLCFVGVSTNEQAPRYNCYPESPTSSFLDELEARRQRSLEDLPR